MVLFYYALHWVRHINRRSVGLWEPSYDRRLWREENELHVYLQWVDQADAEGLVEFEATPISILEYTPN
ncbi:MAG: hypothetical protein P8Z37_06490 [Acidobacteriota bacterium]